MTVKLAHTVTLSHGVVMPQLGIGTWPMNNVEAGRVVAAALNMGYRLIDTAENYENERGVGAGIRNSGVSRREIFVTTKFNRKWHSIEGARMACEASLERLELDYIDLLLVHWPNPDQDRYVEAFQGLVQLLDEGLVRAIGTSNFKPAHLHKLFQHGLVPHVNQIQLDPYHARAEVVTVHQAKGIVTQAWSPLGRGTQLLADPLIADVANRYGRTPAQVVLRWHTQLGYIPTARSTNPERLAQNLDIFTFELSTEELTAISALSRHDPHMPDSDTVGH
jgi:2,5-diketo-D-gluconate reductase A